MSRYHAAAVLLLSFATPSAGQSLGIFADTLGTNCSLQAPFPGGAVICHVVAKIDGVEFPISAAVFRIVDMPPGWIVSVMPGARTSAIGDVLGDGVHVVFNGCVRPVSPLVLLTLILTPTSLVTNSSVHVSHHLTSPIVCSPEAACSAACARFCGCGGFGGPCYCAETTALVINGPPCTTQISQGTWSILKRTFR